MFNLDIAGHANNRFVNNIGRSLVKELKVSYAGETIGIVQHRNLFKTYEDLFIGSDLRESGLLAGAGDKPTSPNAKKAAIFAVHGTKYRILLDHPILNDHGVFYPRGLRNTMSFQLTLADVADHSDDAFDALYERYYNDFYDENGYDRYGYDINGYDHLRF